MHDTDCFGKIQIRRLLSYTKSVCSLTPHFTYACDKLDTLKAINKMSMC